MSILDLFRLDGKTALVTGCDKGMGKAMAQALSEAGANIVGVSRTLPPHGSEVEAEVVALGGGFRGYSCDFSRRADLYEFIGKVKRDVERVDILANNAGMVLRKEALDYADELWDQTLEVDLTAPFILAREFGREMVSRGEGKIIFTASVLSFQGGILVPGYSASKSGLARLTMALANEWASKGVNINAIAPGYISTDITAALRADQSRSEQILSRIPAGRWGVADDIKGAIVFLSSRAADYINGAILTVDGGWMAR